MDFRVANYSIFTRCLLCLLCLFCLFPKIRLCAWYCSFTECFYMWLRNRQNMHTINATQKNVVSWRGLSVGGITMVLAISTLYYCWKAIRMHRHIHTCWEKAQENPQPSHENQGIANWKHPRLWRVKSQTAPRFRPQMIASVSSAMSFSRSPASCLRTGPWMLHSAINTRQSATTYVFPVQSLLI